MNDLEYVSLDGVFDEKLLSGNIFLVVTNPFQLPPHIGISLDGIYYSLKWNGKDNGIKTTHLISFILSKKKPILFFHVVNNSHYSNQELASKFSGQIEKYDRVVPGGPTCLTPILDFLKDELNFNELSINYFFELISKLKNNNKIEGVYYLAEKNIFPENKYQLVKYNSMELEQALSKFHKD